MSSADSLDRASSVDDFDEGNEDEEIVYRSCGGEMDSYPGEEDAQWQYEEAQRQNEEAQRQNCEEQVEILSQIEAELAAGTQPASQSLPHSHHRSTWSTYNIYQARRTPG